MNSIQPVYEIIVSALKNIQQREYRQLLLVSGRREWCQQQISGLTYPAARIVWIGDAGVGLVPPSPLKPISAKQTHQLLGQENDCIVFDCWSGFNPNGFGQVAGTLVAGGIFVLITPPVSTWQFFNDPEYDHIAVEPFRVADVGRRFIRHLQNVIATDADLIQLAEGQPLPDLSLLTAAATLEPHADAQAALAISPVAIPFKTVDQEETVKRCLDLLRQSRAVLVLTADRGRGKSAALGILSAVIMKKGVAETRAVWKSTDAERSGDINGHVEIILTAPSRGAVQSVITMLERLLPADLLEHQRDCWVFGRNRLRFMLPDQLLQQQPEADLLLIDEAAAIPAPVLFGLLEYRRVIFASTLHGYEGTGQGFAVRFMPYLDRIVPERQLLTMQQPVRWAEDDPLERFTYQALLLDAEPAKLNFCPRDSAAVRFRKLDRDQLVADNEMLKQLFGLLILAHYRTTPGDLRILLDSPNIEVWAGFIGSEDESQLVATALLAYEGPINRDLADAIMDGTRRPKGQLIPQTLLAHCHIPEAAECRGVRIMRIAVHPQLQRRGIGSALLQAIEQGCSGIDWLGTSFGATADLLCFWQQFGLRLQRLGHNRDKVSGTHAAVLLRGITTAGVLLQQKGTEKARQQLHRLSDSKTGLISRELLDVLVL